MKNLAEAAGVAIQTIYSTFGSKAGVLMGMIGLIDEQADVYTLFVRIQRTTDPHEAIALFARVRRQIRERCGDIIRVLRTGAGTEADVGAAWAEGMRGRRMGLGAVMERIQENGALKAGLSPDRAADIAAALVTDEVCDVLVEQRGWSYDDYESWLKDALTTLLLAP